MADLPQWTQWLTLLGGAGLLGALIQWLASRSLANQTGRQQAERQIFDLEGQRKRQALDLDGLDSRQRADHTHQRDMLAQAAHFEERKESAELAGNALAWLHHETIEQHGSQADLFPENLPERALSSPGEAIGNLNRIAVVHPTKGVRQAAARVAGELENGYNSIDVSASKIREPDLTEMLEWAQKILDLIELIHEPPGRSAPTAAVL